MLGQKGSVEIEAREVHRDIHAIHAEHGRCGKPVSAQHSAPQHPESMKMVAAEVMLLVDSLWDEAGF
jgi:hypothetical protein